MGLLELKNKLLNCEKIIGTTFTCVQYTGFIQNMKNPDLDFLLFDTEHGSMDIEDFEPMLRMCRLLEIPSIVRVKTVRSEYISKALDLGADSIMIPRCETLDEIETAVSAMRFFPAGKKGCGGFSILREGESLEDFNQNRFLFVQLESPEGIDRAEEMLHRYGDEIAAFVVGPYDLSIMCRTPFDLESEIVVENIKKVIAASKAYQKSCGIFCDSVERAELWHEMGMNILWSGTDASIFMDGYQRMMDSLSKIR